MAMLLADGKATRECGVADGAGWRTGSQQSTKHSGGLFKVPTHRPPKQGHRDAFSMTAFGASEVC
jgi:hypothetical protein